MTIFCSKICRDPGDGSYCLLPKGHPGPCESVPRPGSLDDEPPKVNRRDAARSVKVRVEEAREQLQRARNTLETVGVGIMPANLRLTIALSECTKTIVMLDELIKRIPET